MTRTERGSATLHTLFAAVLLFTALTAAILWSAISTTRHKLAAAADLTALSAAQSLNTIQSPTTAQPSDIAQPSGTAPCVTAARVAVVNKVRLAACVVASGAVTVEVSLELDLRVARPTLTAAARAGPL
ncbi:pilus assembly protein TadG-related protein [Kribbella sp. C-35]|uniref:pilus assembly protein TadG-related protein n=1 Tax=Kribbella sp. C-35 TaxID=2789276 RepID=UPI00397DDCA7